MTLKHSTKEDGLLFISDPGHGWLRVPLNDVRESGIEVSKYSYMDDTYAYLEEDRDATLYVLACGYDMKGNTIQTKLEFAGGMSRVRGMKRYEVQA